MCIRDRDESEWRLFTVVFVYGAGITENWGLVGFFPILLTAIIWLRRLDFFQVRFLARLTAWALAGTAFFLLLPLVMKFSGKYPISLWDALLPNLRTDWQALKSITDGGVRHNLALMSLSTLLPAFVMSIRWSPSFGDSFCPRTWDSSGWTSQMPATAWTTTSRQDCAAHRRP